MNAPKAFITVSVELHFAFKVLRKWKHAILGDFSAFFKIPLNALKTLIWPLLLSVRLHFAFKVLGK